MPCLIWMQIDDCHGDLYGRWTDRAFLAWMDVLEVTSIVCFTWTFHIPDWRQLVKVPARSTRRLPGDTRKWQFGLLHRKLCCDLFFSFLADFWFDSYSVLSSFLSVCTFSCAAFNNELCMDALGLQVFLSFLGGETTWILRKSGTMTSMFSQLDAKKKNFLNFLSFQTLR